jgi:hypothetical protein
LAGEFVFRFNRRKTDHTAFGSLRDIGSAIKLLPYKTLVAPEEKL